MFSLLRVALRNLVRARAVSCYCWKLSCKEIACANYHWCHKKSMEQGCLWSCPKFPAATVCNPHLATKKGRHMVPNFMQVQGTYTRCLVLCPAFVIWPLFVTHTHVHTHTHAHTQPHLDFGSTDCTIALWTTVKVTWSVVLVMWSLKNLRKFIPLECLCVECFDFVRKTMQFLCLCLCFVLWNFFLAGYMKTDMPTLYVAGSVTAKKKKKEQLHA